MISVVMASYLGKYNGAAKDRKTKFLRAVNSCLEQKADFELVIVSDGCQDTVDLCPQDPRIQLYKVPKQPTWSAVVRNTGIHYAKGSHIVYLDTDDVFGPDHLSTIEANLPKVWGMFNDFVWKKREWVEREASLTKFHCGTSNLVHKRDLYWPEDANDYEHDWMFVRSLMLFGAPEKLPTPDYRVCHLPRRYDV